MSIKDIAFEYIDDLITTGSWRDWLALARDCRERNIRQWMLEATTPERSGIALEHRHCYARWHRFAKTVQFGSINRRAISMFVRQVSKSYDVQSVFLYGSRARGDHRASSDINLAVVVSATVCSEFSDDRTELEIAAAVRNEFDCRCALISPVLIRQAELSGEVEHYNQPLLESIREDGVLLYDAGPDKEAP